MKEINTPLILILVILFSFLANKLISRFSEKISFIRGLIFSIFGVALGPSGFALISSERVASLNLLFYILAGILSFSLGLRLKGFAFEDDVTLRKEIDGKLVRSIIKYLIFILPVFFLCGFIFYLLPITFVKNGFTFPTLDELLIILQNNNYSLVILSLSLISLSLFSSGIKHFIRISEVKSDSFLFHFIYKTSDLISALAIVILAIVQFILILFIKETSLNNFEIYLGILVSLIIGPIMGLLFKVFTQNKDDTNKTNLAILGTVFFVSGIGIYLGAGALFTSLLTGIMFSFIIKEPKEVIATFQKIENPIFAMIVIVASLNIEVPSKTTLLILGIYVFLRLKVNVRILDFALKYNLKEKGHVFYSPARGLMAQDSFPVIAAFLAGQHFPFIKSELLIVSILGMIIFEWPGSKMARSLLLDGDELLIEGPLTEKK